MKGKINIVDLIDAPFGEVHELYRLVFLKAEAKAKEEKEKQEAEQKQKEEELKKYRNSHTGITSPRPIRPNNKEQTKISNESPLQFNSDDLEDALEELAEGGI